MTVDRVLLIVAVAGLGLVVVWLALLTFEQRRTRDRLGTPVYRRLPDGRVAFSWSAHKDYHATRQRDDASRETSDIRTHHS